MITKARWGGEAVLPRQVGVPIEGWRSTPFNNDLTSLGASKELEKMEIILGVEMDSTLIIVRLV
jgi:hypothetical protein